MSDIDIAREALAHLSVARASDQSLWLAVGMAARSIHEDLFADFDNFSRLAPDHYNERDTATRWRSFPAPNGQPEIGKLIAWAKKDSPGWRPKKGNFAKPADTFEQVARRKQIAVASMKAYGAELAQRGKLPVVRFPVWNEKGERHSYFDLPPSDGKGWFSKGEGSSGLFLPGRLPAAGETWHVVEGVKDACALHALGLLACGLPTSKLSAKYARLFAGVHVVVIPDRDKAGESGSQKSGGTLHGVAASVRIAMLPAEFKVSSGADVRDVLAMRGGEQLLRQALEDAKEWRPGVTMSETTSNHPQQWPLTDLGNAERFAARHGDKVRYVHQWGEWLVWDSTRWAKDLTGEVVRLAKASVRSIYQEAAAVDDKDHRKRIADWAKASESVARIEALMKLAKSERPIPIGIDELDANPWLLNTKSGTINLQDGTLHDHRREDSITRIAPIDYSTEAGDDPELWLSFLNLIFAENRKLIEFMQRYIGSSLVGQVFDHVLAILYGNGQNGKSTLLEAITNMLGDDYAMVASPDLLMPKKGERHPTELADLCGKRFVAAEETEDNCRLAESLAKHLTGGTKIRARRMREDTWQFAPSHTLALATNHRPIIRGVDLGIWRRIRLIPFTVQIPDTQVDKAFGDKLKAEYPAILRWAVSGCLQWQQEGLGEPPEVRFATAQYRADSDAIGQFIEERCTREGEVQAAVLYKSYRTWAESAGEYAGSQTWFGNKLTELGFGKIKKDRVYYQGISTREGTG